ncbi:MAG: ABC transporter ATP-binding protein [Oscillospiraceae bacterium]|nr:ABC transporter ATP-binding protein [Oscillospiraceae bacterium]
MPPQIGPPGRGPGAGPAGRFGAQKVKPKDMKKAIFRLLKYIGSDKARVALAVICVLISTGTNLAGTYMLRPIINGLDSAIEGGDKLSSLAHMLLIMAGIYLAGVIAAFIQQRTMIKVSQNTLKRIRDDLFSKLQKLSVRYYDTNSTGDIMSRFTNDVDNIGQMFDSTILQIFSGVLTLIGTLALMLKTNIPLTAVTIILTPIIARVAGAITKRTRKYFGKQQTALGAVNGYIEETITGQKVVKVFNHEARAKDEFRKLNEDLRNVQVRANFLGGIMGPCMNALSQISYTATAFIGATLALFTKLGKIGTTSFAALDIGGLTVFVNYSKQFSRPINEISNQMNVIMSALAGAERVFAVMDEEPEAANDSNKVKLDRVRGDVVLKDVTFGYNPDKTILKNISMYAHPGQKIALVGSTGAGKTTIINLLTRFYDIQSGEITIDGVNLKDIDRETLRSNIAMVLQDTHLFTGTVMENIRYGRLDATDDEVRAAAMTSCAHMFIRNMPDGYDTMLTGDGSNLSQGQRQLLNIARAALSKAPILILDEATSSVDTRTEQHINRGMDALMENRTTFVIAHRLSTIKNSDAIMVLENGEIIERGTHDELLDQKGRYYELYTGKKELD